MAELDNLLVNDLVSLGITDAISEDDEVSGQHAVVLSGKHVDCLLERLFKLGLNNLLPFALDDILRVILAQLLICAGSKANYRVRARMTHVNTDQHRSHIIHNLGELQVEEIALDFGVDLTQDV